MLSERRNLYKKYNVPVIADDSGLCVNALNGAPVIYSHRFAGLECNDEKNNALLIKKMQGIKDRSAYYECVICYFDSKPHFFKGQIHGEIIDVARGHNGFGYDPILYVPEYGMTTGDLEREFKKSISHRGIALNKMREILKAELY